MIAEATLNGHQAVYLENDLLRVCVLPEKGADIYELIHRASGIDCLMKTPAGLQPPQGLPQADFLDNYEGGWQELLPNANDSCRYRGQMIPFHGEAALLPWDVTVLEDSEREAAVRFTVVTRLLPLRLERTLRLCRGEPVLYVEECLVNQGIEDCHVQWGHHLVLGAPFLEAGCRLEAAGRTIITGDVLYEPDTARLAPGQRSAWPLACARNPGVRVDLREIPGPEAHTHDDAILADFERGHLAVSNPRLGLAFTLHWDSELFRYAMLWMPYGGAELAPLTGIYGLGVEPWVSCHNLEAAIAHQEALLLKPGAQVQTDLRARFG